MPTAVSTKKQKFQKIPLRLVLILPFVLQIFGMVGLTGYLSLHNGQKAVNGMRPAIKIIKEYAPSLPKVECYPGLLNQVFMNLLANAIDALEDVPNPTIIISTKMQTDKTIEIRITDNGMGMSSEIKQKLFQPLFTTKTLGKGTGLGLSIARQILEERHSGKITFESDLGKGTVFILVLPNR